MSRVMGAAPQRPGDSELKDALRATWPMMRKVVGFGVFIALLSLAPVQYMNDVYGPAINSGSVRTLFMLTLPLIGALATVGLLEWVRGKILLALSAELGQGLSARILRASFTANLQRHPGASQALGDLRTLKNFLGAPAFAALLDAPAALLVLALVFWIDTRLGLGSTLGALLMFGVNYWTEQRTQLSMAKASRFALESQKYAVDSAQNTSVIESMGMLASVTGRWEELQREFTLHQGEASNAASGAAAVSKFVMLTQGSLMLGLGCWLMLSGAMVDDGSGMMVASILAGRAIAPLLQMTAAWRQILQVQESFLRLDAFLRAVPAPRQTMKLPDPVGQLTVQNAFVQAPGALPGTGAQILRNVNLTARPGEILAVIGASGAGKSTLTRVLVGIWPPAAGTARLDGADIFQWDKSELGRHIGYLPQDIELFSGTMAENIARFGAIDPEKLARAVSAVGLGEVIDALPEGLDTPIGDQGTILSGGQRQRVALARAVYGDPRLVVLDEPDASLDPAGRAALQQTLKALKETQATVVVVSHSMPMITLADRIAMMQDGTVSLEGPTVEVLQKLGVIKPVAPPAPAPESAPGPEPTPEPVP